MKIYKNLSIEVPGTNTHYFDLEDFGETKGAQALYYGWAFLTNGTPPELLRRQPHNSYLNVVSPTEFCGPYDISCDNSFDKIFSICPYTVEWLNKIKGTNKYKTIWYPFHRKYIPTNNKKKYDVCYHGGIHGTKYVEMLSILKNFNYRYMSMGHSINPLTQQSLSYATNLDLSHTEKMALISQCKISVCYNNFPVRGPQDISHIKEQPSWDQNSAFSHIESAGIIPQLKSRFIEASLSKTLNLVERDPWNVIEKWYNPGEHFVYFDGNKDLHAQISHILENWNLFDKVVQNSYNHSLGRYTCDSLTDHILSS
tara:strand:+ start:91 stop:1026 length:936 start_codon:yes stop_codon:yes gene_type:complete